MRDLYLVAATRTKELELRRAAELAHRRRTPPDAGQSVSRPRIVLAEWLLAAAERLWPEAGRTMAGGAR